MEQLNYNLLYRWFVGLGVDEMVWVPTVFTKNRDRLLEAEVARNFLAELLNHKEVRGLLSDEHFLVDGTQVAVWASMKSLFDGRAPSLFGLCSGWGPIARPGRPLSRT
jgi:transposase